MVQTYTTGNKISFQTVDMEVSLAQIEYEYLKFVCDETLRTSDDIIREQIRNFQIPGKVSFDEWRQRYGATETSTEAATSGLNGTAAHTKEAEVSETKVVATAETNGASEGEPVMEALVEAPKRRGRSTTRARKAAPAVEPQPTRQPRSTGRRRKTIDSSFSDTTSGSASQDSAPAEMSTPEANSTSLTSAAFEANSTDTSIEPPAKATRGRSAASTRKTRTTRANSRNNSAAKSSTRRSRTRSSKSDE